MTAVTDAEVARAVFRVAAERYERTLMETAFSPVGDPRHDTAVAYAERELTGVAHLATHISGFVGPE